MLFVKYLSDVCAETKENYMLKYAGDGQRVARAMSREAFVLNEESTFDYLYANRNDSEIGQKINIALNQIEEHNSGKLRNVFRAIDFNSQVDFGEKREKNATLKNLLEDFHVLDLRPSVLESNDIIGDAYEYMIANFASDAGKKGGEFFTPSPACVLVFKKNRAHKDVLFIDASGEGNYEKGKNQNILRDEDIDKIVSTFKSYEAVEKYAYKASRDEIRENEYNLNIPRYVDTFEEEELIDIDEVRANIASIDAELKEVQAQMEAYLKELGV